MDDDGHPALHKSSSKTRSGRKRARPVLGKSNARQKEEAEHSRIEAAVAAIPCSSNVPIFRVNRRQRAKQREAPAVQPDSAEDPAVLRAGRFAELPLSVRTLEGLAAGHFERLTPIQQRAIPQALAGRDVLAAAPTGSGKTLAFVVPLLESLWRKKWSTQDKLGALILAPTRELAIQIFEVIRIVGRRHMISAGLVIGGKDFEGERQRVGSMNVLVATPGRLLHHMDNAADLDCYSLQLLVLDEADRILDMGFSKTLDAILQNLPKNRQTLLFSATQTKSVKALARLSLSSPQYVSVMSRVKEPESEDGKVDDIEEIENDGVNIVGTPKGLSQSYAVVKSHEKLAVLWSFIRTHLKAKMIVFFATGKQVRFAFETFCKMRPGMSLLHIHGNMKQLKRTDMYDAFSRTKNAALFATDVASRGLDFPNVDWVVQVDCPDDVSSYVHRVGRTARFSANGRSMLFLNEGKEEAFLGRLQDRKVTLARTRINPNKLTQVTPRIAAVVAANHQLKELAQRAFLFYLKSVYQQSDKDVFDAAEHNIELLAKSFGLAVTPVVNFKTQNEESKKNLTVKDRKTVFGYRLRSEIKPAQSKRRRELPMDSSKPLEEDERGIDSGADEGDEILSIKRVYDPDGGNAGELDERGTEITSRKRKRLKLDLVNKMPSVNRIVYDDGGVGRRASELLHASQSENSDSDEQAIATSSGHENISDYASAVSKRLEAVAEADKRLERDRIRAKHSKRKSKKRELNRTKKPNADVQQQLLSGSHSDELNSSNEEESQTSDFGSGVSSASSAEGVGSSDHDDDMSLDSGDGYSIDALEDQEELALQILASRK